MNILETLNLEIGDKVTNGRGNVFTVTDSTEDREIKAFSPTRYAGPSVEVTGPNGRHKFWVDIQLWYDGDWVKL